MNLATLLSIQEYVPSREYMVLGLLSPLTRYGILCIGEINLGGSVFKLSHGILEVFVAPKLPPPPIEWWKFSGLIHITSDASVETVYSFVAYLKQCWPACRIVKINLKLSELPDDVRDHNIAPLLCLLKEEIVTLEIDSLSLRSKEELPHLTLVEAIYLSNFEGSLGHILSALRGPLRVIEVSNCFSLEPSVLRNICSNNCETIILDNSNVTGSCIDDVKSVETLQTLSLIGCRKLDTLNVGRFTALMRLFLGCTLISTRTLCGLEACRNLVLLNLGGCKGIDDVNALRHLKKLKELFAHETSLTDAGILGLGHCSALEKLNLGGCGSISSVNVLGSLRNLSELHLWNTRVSDAGIQGLRTCVALTELILDNCSGITDVSVLSELSDLRWLSLIGTEVNLNGIRKLVECPILESLAIGGTRIENAPKLWHHETIIDFLSRGVSRTSEQI